MAVRYSGQVKISLHDAKNHYDVRLSTPGERPERIHVGAPAHLTHSVDSPIAYDRAAHAAISFSSNDMQEKAEMNRSMTGWDIRRKR